MRNRLSEPTEGRHALVIGGSLAGLLAARVLSDHFERVTVVERDSFPQSPEARRGTPQANHVHALMPRGRQIVERLFPGLQHEMMAAGAPLIDLGRDVNWLTPPGWGVNFNSGLEVLGFTRPLLDFYVRQRLLTNSAIRFIENTEFLRLIPTNGDSVGGAIVRMHAANGESIETKLISDLVVDASGRSSRAQQWLAEIGYTSPKETRVNAHLGYASRLYQIPNGFSADWSAVFVQCAPPVRKRGGLLLTVEDNRWLLTLIGGGRDYPPNDDAGFLEFARSLPSSIIYDAIKGASPLSSIKTHRGTENRLRHFEKLTQQPRNFIAMGDSVCAFNPVYGQGMTVAALGAMTLDDSLRSRGIVDRNFSRQFQRQLAKVTSGPWMMATSEDFRYKETEGGVASRMTRFMHLYMDEVLRASTFDRMVRYNLLQAFGMLVSPLALFRPGVLIRVLRSAVSRVLDGKRKKGHETVDRVRSKTPVRA
ncbi:MAG TPA: hypothetical protein VIX17_00415 [Pyrinomonadaceae bacterium]|jgi:2-polyprenyl-6-methoxyphenol hydroxylase-like FAD-dependent oxidoreductase